MIRSLALLLAVVAMALVACSDDDTDAESPSETSAPQSEAQESEEVGDTDEAGGGGSVAIDEDAPAATVNGTEISIDQIRDELVELAYVDDTYDLDFIQLEAARDDQGEFTDETIREGLASEIRQLVVLDLLAERGVEVTEEDEERARQRVEDQVPDFDELDDRARAFLSESVGRDLATLEALFRVTIAEEGIAETPEEYFEADPERFTEVCVRHVLVPDADAIEAVIERLEAGEDFAQVAEDVSEDPGSAAEGGQLPCSPAAVYVPEFAEAALAQPLGELGEPVESQFGFHVLIVDERIEPVYEGEVVQAVAQAYQQEIVEIEGELLGSLQEALNAADVELGPGYGEWVNGEIVG